MSIKMCEQCVAKTLNLGEIAPGYFLVKATRDGNEMSKGDYGIIRCNDPDIVIPASFKFVTDPYFEKSDEEIEAMSEDANDFEDLVDELRKHLASDFQYGYELTLACKEVGWEQEKHGSVTFWLVNKMATLVKKFDETVNRFRSKFSIEDLKKIKGISSKAWTEANEGVDDFRVAMEIYNEKLLAHLSSVSPELVQEFKFDEEGNFFNMADSIVEDEENKNVL